MSVHALWVHPAVDLHLALHEVAAEQARQWGGHATVIAPLTPRPPCASSSTSEGARALAVRRWAVRAELGLRADERAALVIGGSLGIGDLEESALDLLRLTGTRPVVLCGTNDGLRRRLAQHPGVIALGWRDDLADLMVSVDCVVQNAGGFMSLEALAAGVPLVSYRCLPGHGVTNAAALEQAGLAVWALGPEELDTVLGCALAGTGRRPGPPALGLLEALSPAAVPVSA